MCVRAGVRMCVRAGVRMCVRACVFARAHASAHCQVARRRRDLKLVVMSATLDAGKFTEYFADSPLLEVRPMVHARAHPFPGQCS